MVDRMTVWPVMGNHDDNGPDGTQPFLDAFYLPVNDLTFEEAFYSFSYANVNFFGLDTNRSTNLASEQGIWLDG